MRFALLGPLTVHDSKAARPISSPKGRALLGALLLRPNHAVPLDTLEAVLWGEHPPATASASLHNHVARLRRLLAEDGEPRLRAVPGGYLLTVGAGELDSELFAERLERARADRLRQDWAGVARETVQALELWRGAPLANLPDPALSHPEVRPQLQQLQEARLQALEWRFDAELRLGRHGGLTPELARLAEEHPLREVFHRQLMLVLHRTDRQAEALAVFHRLRRTLIDELGIEPGPAMQEAYQDILTAQRAAVSVSPTAPALPDAPGTPGGPGTPATPPLSARRRRQAPAQLPSDILDFAGREAELEQLSAMLRPDPAVTVPRVVVVSGMAGVGKTALAVHAAHRLRDQFPDGQLHADLRGFGAGDARSPHDLLARFLTDLGVREKSLPELSGVLSCGERAVELHREAGDPRGVATVLGSMGDALMAAGEPTAAAERYREALELWRDHGVLDGTATTLTRLGDALTALDHPAEAFQALEEALRIRLRLGEHIGTADTLETIALAHFHFGDQLAAREHWERSVTMGRRLRLPPRGRAFERVSDEGNPRVGAPRD